ncbi:MAG: hypothetical protein OEW58_03345 [Gammaproteobacteria bacterium]|nr:hypothetical protein [Gammaproteobacteria bacterium]
MGIIVQRGQISAISAPDKDGSISCRLGEQAVKVHRDLADKVANGDDVMVAGEMKDQTLHAMALNNFSQGMSEQIDCTNNILLMGIGNILFVFLGIIGLQGISGSNIIDSVELVIAVAGLVLAVIAYRRMVRIIRSNNIVKYVEL